MDLDMSEDERVKLQEKLNKAEKEEDSNDATDSSSASSGPIREVWGGKIEFMLSLIGYSVAFGNLQRFPYLCAKNGGGAFLIPYMCFLIICGIPLYYLEVCLGQFAGTSPLFVWRLCPLFMGIGSLMCIVSGICCWYYNTLIAWSLYYLVNSFTSLLPWSSCGNWWNSLDCFNTAESQRDIIRNASYITNSTQSYNGSVNMDNLITVGHGNISASLEYWQHNVLRMSDGLHDIGHLQWHMVIALMGAWFLVFICLAKGVESLGKVVYVTVVLPYLLYVAFLIRGLLSPGSFDGVLYYLTPQFDKLVKPQVWLEAAIQVFFSLGPVWGGVITMSSYNKFHDNCLKTTLLVTVTEGFTSFAFGFAVFATLGFMAYDLNVPIEEVAKSDPGLIFITYPAVISKFPLPQLWAVMFWVMMITVGLDTEFGMFETLSSGIIDAFPKHLSNRKTLVVAMLSAAFFLLGLPLATQGGIYIYQLVDWYAAAFCMVLCAFLETIVVGWIYGAERFSRDVELMTGRPVPVLIRICWCFITPATLLILFVVTLHNYTAPTYNDYTYPSHAVSIGVLIGLLPILPVPIVMAYQIAKAKGSLMERIRYTIKPSSLWLPREEKYQDLYRSLEDISFKTGQERIKENLLGSKRHWNELISPSKC